MNLIKIINAVHFKYNFIKHFRLSKIIMWENIITTVWICNYRKYLAIEKCNL